MSEEKYINEEGFFIGDWTAEDAEEYFSNTENQVKKLVINKTFSNLDWIRHLKEVEELDIGHWKGEFDGSDIILDLGLLPHNPKREQLKISFECELKSLLNWHKTDATELHFCEFYVGKDAEEHGFIHNPQEPWGEGIQKITIYENRAPINLQNFNDKSLKYYHDEQFYYFRDNLELDYICSRGGTFGAMEARYEEHPEKATTATEVQLLGDYGYVILDESNHIFTIMKTKKIQSYSEDDDMFEALEAKGEEEIQRFVASLPSWPCEFHFGNLGLGKDELPKIFKAMKAAGHTLNGV